MKKELSLDFKEKLWNMIKKTLNLSNEEINFLKDNKAAYKETKDPEKKEKFFIFYTYYNFIHNNSCVSFLEKSFNFIENLEIQEKRRLLKVFPNESLLICLTIILKSFISRTTFYHQEVENVNSDDCINYCTDEFKKYCCLNKIYVIEKKIRNSFLGLFSILIDEGLITSRNIDLYISNDQSIKILKYFYIPNIDYYKIIEEFFNFSYIEYKLLIQNDVYYIYTFHYSRTFEICKKNFYSNKTFKIKNLNYIIKKVNVRLYVDEEFQKCNQKFFNVSEEFLINEINLLRQKYLEYFENNKWTSEIKDEISDIQRQMSKLVETIVIKLFLNYNFSDDSFFFPLFIDFRGRKYYDSMIGPTHSKTLRLAYYYGHYTALDFYFQFRLKSIETYKKLIYNFCLDFHIPLHEHFYQTIYWCLIGIGKHFINKNKSRVSELEFIENGLYFFYGLQDKIPKITDLMEIEHYVRIIYSLDLNILNLGICEEGKKNTSIKKRVIVKDATASLTQIFMKELGPLNQESLNYVNLGNKNEWYDTYIIHREKFYEFASEKDKSTTYLADLNLFNKVLSRPLIKKLIMVIPYSAGFNLCWQNYVIMVKSENLIINCSAELKKLIKQFYGFVKKEMQDKFLYSSNTWTYIAKAQEIFEEERKFLIETRTGAADLSYHKMKKASLDKKYTLNGKKKRITKLILEVTNAIDIKEFNKAIGANIAHFFDADEVREVELELSYSVLTVHDSYLVDFLNTSRLIHIRTEHYSKRLQKYGPYEVSNIFNLI